MVKSSNFYSFSSSSSSSDDHQGKRKRHDRKENDGGELARECGRHRQRHDEDHRTIKKTPTKKLAMPLPPALSDYDELRAHYRFVLPDDDDETIYNDNKNNTTTATNDNNRKKYGSTWQERMVKNYHQGLYKEYVLADLSRVVEIGKIGLRWRTEVEVSNGRGFRYCGNLTCRSVSSTTMTNISTAVGGVAVNGGGGGGGSNKCDAAVIRIQQQQQAEQEAYKTAARRHVGIGVPENGGKEPMGMFLPPPPPPASNATCEDNIDSLELYLRSCHDDALGRVVRGEDKRVNDSDDDDNKKCRRVKNRRRRHSSKKEDERRRSKHNMQKFSHSRRRRRSEGHSDDDDDDDGREEEQEREERTRLSNVQHGIGLHDYEIDFAYIECGIQKRELVKVRLCLRCAPLLFVARNNSNSSIGSSVVVAAPAMKARLAREDAAMRNRAMLMNGGNNIVIAE